MACGGGICCWINHETGLPDLFTLCRIVKKKQSGIPVLQGYWDITSSRGVLWGLKTNSTLLTQRQGGSKRKANDLESKLQHRGIGNFI